MTVLYALEGPACQVWAENGPGRTPLYRGFNASGWSGAHFYTIDYDEFQNAIKNAGFTDEGIACWVLPRDSVTGQNLLRAYNKSQGKHFYTTSPSELQNAIDNELRVFASRSRCKNSVGLNAVGAEGSATAHGNFSWDRALEATTENGWKALGFALVAIARLEIAGAGPMDFVSR
jgi:hypothetical protein